MARTPAAAAGDIATVDGFHLLLERPAVQRGVRVSGLSRLVRADARVLELPRPGPLAQLVEQLTLNQQVQVRSPGGSFVKHRQLGTFWGHGIMVHPLSMPPAFAAADSCSPA